MSDHGAVRFRVFKGSKFMFECEIARADTLPATLRQQLVRADEFGLLRNADLVITKRLNLVEVDRMISCCRQHPPQAVVTLITEYGTSENNTAFEDFAAYLKERERAGVASLPMGVLVLFIPLIGRRNYMQCQIVNTKTTVGEIGAQVSLPPPREVQPSVIQAPAPLAVEHQAQDDVFIKEEVLSPVGAPTQVVLDTQPVDTMYVSGAQAGIHQARTQASITRVSSPPPAAAPVLELPVASNGAVAGQISPSAATTLACRNVTNDSATINTPPKPATQDSNTVAVADVRRLDNGDQHSTTGSDHLNAVDESEPENPDLYAEFRQEYDAFNAFYHHVLLEWSTKPAEVDSPTDPRRQALP